jgi:hypothetical protein
MRAAIAALAFCTLVGAAPASDELQLIRTTLFAMTGRGAFARPLDRKPLIGSETVPPTGELASGMRMIIEMELAGAPSWAAETYDAWMNANENSLSLRDLTVRKGSEVVPVEWDSAKAMLAKHPDRDGVVLLTRPVIAPNNETAFVAVMTIERELRVGYVYTFHRDREGTWRPFRYATPIAVRQ